MKKLNVTLYGTSPLIMHSPQGVNPLHPVTMEKKKYTSKRKKTDEDYKIISDLEWLEGVYWEDNIGLYIPNECIAATLMNGAKFNRNGANISRYCHVVDSMIPLDIGEAQNLDVLKTENRFRDVRSVVVKRDRVIRTRPRFNTWSTTFVMLYEEDKVNLDVIVQAFENAGSYVGLCEMRTMGYGKFNCTIEEID